MDQEVYPCHDFTTIFCASCGTAHRVRIDCGFRFCPECSRPRAARIRRLLNRIISDYPPPPGQNLKMITLSTRNCQNLGIGIRHLVASFRKLRQQKFWRRYCSGGATIIEITGRKGDYHPHLHILCYSDYIPWFELRKRWQSVSGGIGVWISTISRDRAMYYVTKYTTKCEAPEADFRAISNEIKKFRLFQRFGLWHSFVLPRLKADFPCPKCHGLDWISIFDISRLSRTENYRAPPVDGYRDSTTADLKAPPIPSQILIF